MEISYEVYRTKGERQAINIHSYYLAIDMKSPNNKKNTHIKYLKQQRLKYLKQQRRSYLGLRRRAITWYVFAIFPLPAQGKAPRGSGRSIR